MDRLTSLVEPSHTAVLTMELQRGVVGDMGLLPALVEEVGRSGMLRVVGEVCTAARAAGARVVHCTAESREDGAGAAVNCKILALADKMRRQGQSINITGSAGAAL